MPGHFSINILKNVTVFLKELLLPKISFCNATNINSDGLIGGSQIAAVGLS